MILNTLSSVSRLGRAAPRLGVSLALAVSMFGAGAGQLVHAQGLPPATGAVDVDGARLPFIVCGVDTLLQSGGHQSILLASGGVPLTPAQIDPAAVGRTFSLHGRMVADCGAGRAFKGLADRTANAGPVTMPSSLGWLSGDRAGPTDGALDALSCAFSAAQGCTMLVPVASGTAGDQLQSVVYALMEVNPVGANGHSGRLLGDSSALNLQQP